ncbi:hypothetical protein NP233_g4910 [Leucocoprinus birnbaumii]|uniref:Uncharacterized protein n=1 Tax=Leucocoprinus birnbaumii TaxID=56174 RepID=A0AAD5W084_9AGAR|nr:hypothetical protein NP233_g4910 [Leucocoprinus birnbaumii]
MSSSSSLSSLRLESISSHDYLNKTIQSNYPNLSSPKIPDSLPEAELKHRYDFAHFTPFSTSITILHGTQPLYTLSSDFTSLNHRSQPHVFLRPSNDLQFDSRGEHSGPCVIFHPKSFRSNIIEIQLPSPMRGGNGRMISTLKIALNDFLRTRAIGGIGPVMEVTVKVPSLIGLPEGSTLLWLLAPDRKSMTLYSAASWGSGAGSNLLAKAFFSQSAPSHIAKLTAIEIIPNASELLLIYTLISASIIESRLTQQSHKAEQLCIFSELKTLEWLALPFQFMICVL